MERITPELIENTYLFCAKRLSDAEAAKDLAQDILYEAIRADSEGKEFVSFYSWYWRMARNKYADLIAHRKNPALPIDTLIGVPGDSQQPVEKLIEEEELSYLRFSLSRLASAYREILVRFYLKEQSVNIIAKELGIPTGTVKSRLFDARQRLRKEYGSMNIGQTAYAPAEVNWFWGGSMSKAEEVMNGTAICRQAMVICRMEEKTLNEIADEMGVAPIYLGEILEKMVDVKLLISPSKGKYLANCCVFPWQEYAETEYYANSAFYDNGFPERITDVLYSLKEEITALDFYGNDFDYNYLMWLFYVTASYEFSKIGIERYIKRRGGGVPERDNRNYWLTMMFLPADKQLDTSRFTEWRAVSWSNLTNCYKTAKYGTVSFTNDFDISPFQSSAETTGARGNSMDGSNISLIIDLSKEPGKTLTVYEEEQAANLLKYGLLKKKDNGLVPQLPIFPAKIHDKITHIIKEALRPIAEEYADLVGGEVEKRLSPYVRKDMLGNFIYHDIGVFFQVTCGLFYYGWDKVLKQPEDYSASAAGLYIKNL